MKISSASKKVLASALSAAMVVAFAPTAAFAVTADTDTSKWTDDAWLAAGYTVKLTSIDGSKIQTDYYTDLNAAFKNGVKHTGDTTAQALSGTLTLLADQTDVFATDDAANGTTANNRKDKVAIDLNGHTITNRANSDKATLTVAAGDEVTFKGEGTVASAVEAVEGGANGYQAVTGGTVNVEGGTFANASKKVAVADDLATVKGGTFEGEVSGTLATVKGGTFKGKASGSATSAEVSGGAFEAGVAYSNANAVAVSGGTFAVSETKDYEAQVGTAAENSTPASADYKAAKAHDAVALSAPSATVTFSKTVSVDASAAGQDSYATAVKASKVKVASKANLTVKAAAKGLLSGDRPGTNMNKIAADAVAISGDIEDVAKDATVSVEATASDADAHAYAIKGDVTHIAAGEYKAAAVEDENAVAISGAIATYVKGTSGIEGGKFTGELKTASSKSVAAGSFVTYKTNLENFKAEGATVSDDSTTQVVYLAGGFAYAKGKTDDVAVSNGSEAVSNATAELKKALLEGGSTTVKVAYAEGQSADTLKQLIVDGKTVTAKLSLTKYNVKTGTDAEAEVLKKINEYASKANSAALETYYKLAIDLQYVDDKGDVVKVGQITDLGSAGRETRTVNLNFGIDETKDAQAANTVVSVIDGTVSVVEYKSTKAGKLDSTVEVGKAGAYAATALSLASLDQAISGTGTSTDDSLKAMIVAMQDELAASKAKGATKTVKLAKKATKTKKAQTVALKAVKSASGAQGAFAKKSGSKKVTVSKAGKAKLAKGVKKGTYKATVTVTVGQSSQDVTVKFVVKK